ncbi:hypothetical protein SNE40_006867 [Patella caerulea]|uniref:Uncharacterized protein n=1 Tax=Patella caerulea TaxID=87958 RepID=A0AAN8K4Q3_PATCE
MKIPPTLLPNTTVHWDVAGITSALLSIETCGSVDLILTTTSSGDYYQVGFGDCSNTPCTTITKFLSSTTPTTMTATVNPLQCSSFTDIWISWESSARKIEVGTGRNLNQNVLVAMENLEDLNTIIKMEPRGTNTTQWKLGRDSVALLRFVVTMEKTGCSHRVSYVNIADTTIDLCCLNAI